MNDFRIDDYPIFRKKKNTLLNSPYTEEGGFPNGTQQGPMIGWLPS
jgi:hypothetical protein